VALSAPITMAQRWWYRKTFSLHPPAAMKSPGAYLVCAQNKSFTCATLNYLGGGPGGGPY
jgi:hypothetical protein